MTKLEKEIGFVCGSDLIEIGINIKKLTFQRSILLHVLLNVSPIYRMKLAGWNC